MDKASDPDEDTESCDEDDRLSSQESKDEEPDETSDSGSLKGASLSVRNKNEVPTKKEQTGDCASKNTADRGSPGVNEMDAPIELSEIVICDVCYKNFSDQEQLWVHKLIQSPPIIYSCEKCDIHFQSECAFETHKSLTHPPSPFSPDD